MVVVLSGVINVKPGTGYIACRYGVRKALEIDSSPLFTLAMTSAIAFTIVDLSTGSVKYGWTMGKALRLESIPIRPRDVSPVELVVNNKMSGSSKIVGYQGSQVYRYSEDLTVKDAIRTIMGVMKLRDLPRVEWERGHSIGLSTWANCALYLNA